jgi:phosphoglycerate dehydrogenase-like enzyme
MTSSLVILANKGYFQTLFRYKTEGYEASKHLAYHVYPGNYEVSVGILGVGMIGSKVVQHLKQIDLEVLAYDPFLSDETAKAMGIKKASLEYIFSNCQTISNHMADNEKTKNILNYSLFNLMNETAAFINTGRGATVVEDDLIRALKEKPLRTAILDVTYPEPVLPNHEFLTMPNVILSPHIGSEARIEVARLADTMLEELLRFKAGEQLLYEVTFSMLEYSA